MDLGIEKTPFQKVSDIEIPEKFFNRLKTGVDELDFVFGTGILPGSTMTIKSRPGVGKSVFALTLSEFLAKSGYNVGYTSGEEDRFQLAYNCKRLKVEDLQIATMTDVAEILDAIPSMDFLVIDSFQTLTTTEELSSTEKVKYFNDNLVRKAKESDCSLFFIVQETSSGEIRGGPSLLYATDVNMEIKKCKEDKNIRIIDVYKNRFGATLEHQARFGEHGYEFLGEYEEPEDMKEEKKRQSVKEVRKAEILDMDLPLITVGLVMEHFDIKEQTAKLLLSELENDMKLIKYGRGATAVWKFYNES
jgi:predicted ATP-dependent serine protease